jgi:hypothetical protein
MRTLALPEEVKHWSPTTLREKLVKIGARIVRHGRYVVFQLAGGRRLMPQGSTREPTARRPNHAADRRLRQRSQ